MSNAAISQTITTRSEGRAAAKRLVDWQRPMMALVAARLCKSRIEIECSHRTRGSPRVPQTITATPSALHNRSTGSNGPLTMCAQGDILLERVADQLMASNAVDCAEAKCIVLGRGEFSGHHHTVRGRVRFTHDSARARDIPDGLYLGHLDVIAEPAELTHQQHAAITLRPGTYRVRRQRRLEPTDAEIIRD